MKRKILNFLRSQPRWRLIVAGILVLAGVGLFFKGGKAPQIEITALAKRGDLDITVLEGGSVEALESQEVMSEVRGAVKILKIVEEGYIVTDEDVKNGKVLIELDSADLRDRIVQEEISFQSAVANLTDAVQGYEIQRNQNTSNIKAADAKALFARMDMEKYLGDKSANEIIRLLKLDKMESAVKELPDGDDAEAQMISAMEKSDTGSSDPGTNSLSTNEVAKTSTNAAPSVAPLAPKEPEAVIDYSVYAKPDALGDGSAKQDLRRFQDEAQTAEAQLNLAKTKLDGTQRLFAKEFAAKSELDTDSLNYTNCALKVQTTKTALSLFIKYEFPKQARDYANKFEESLRAFEREKKEAISKLAQARAKLKGAERRYNIEASQRKDLLDQLSKCSIKATRTGLVVYGGSSERYFDSNEQIREGATVRERQPLITIPNMDHMSVKVKVHESYIQKICKGLQAKIKVDAFPNEVLSGEVIKVALLPDSQNRWLNPDLKVYQTTVAISATNVAWLKPGMSAKVELLVKRLSDVICVPLQAVTEENGKHYCYVINAKTEKREVEVGDFNDEFIVITSGLNDGEKVSLRAPEAEVNRSTNGDNAAPKAPAGKKGGPQVQKPQGT